MSKEKLKELEKKLKELNQERFALIVEIKKLKGLPKVKSDSHVKIKCSKCGYKTTPGGMARHFKICEGPMLPCKKCGKKFNDYYSQKKHNNRCKIIKEDEDVIDDFVFSSSSQKS